MAAIYTYLLWLPLQARVQALHVAKKFYTKPELALKIEVRTYSIDPEVKITTNFQMCATCSCCKFLCLSCLVHSKDDDLCGVCVPCRGLPFTHYSTYWLTIPPTSNLPTRKWVRAPLSTTYTCTVHFGR